MKSVKTGTESLKSEFEDKLTHTNTIGPCEINCLAGKKGERI